MGPARRENRQVCQPRGHHACNERKLLPIRYATHSFNCYHYLTLSTGLGTRSCVGKALADLELILITATIVQNFRVHLHETTTPESMRCVNGGHDCLYLIQPD